jgi:type IV secretion system protein VirB10
MASEAEQKLAAAEGLAGHEAQEPKSDEHPGGERFNRLLLIAGAVAAMVAGVVLAEGIRTAGAPARASAPALTEGGADEARNRAQVANLAAAGARPSPATVMTVPSAPLPQVQVLPAPPRGYAQWAADKYLRALEAPQMVSAFHGGGTLELAGGGGGQPGGTSSANGTSEPSVTLHPPVGRFAVMSGSVIPAVLVSGINSDLPGPIVAQVSENVFDTATGKSLLVPQGSRLIGAYHNASVPGQQRVQISWQRLIFPDTASMDLPQMPGMDQAGYTGFSDQVDNHYLATFGTAGVISLISAGQMVGQMAGFGGGSYGAYGYTPPNQWAMAGESAGSAASAQLGGVAQQMVGQGLNRPPTIEIRPGYQFTVMVTADLIFPGPYKS